MSSPTSLSLVPFLFGQAAGLNVNARKQGGLTFSSHRSNVPDFLGGARFDPNQLGSITDLTRPINTFSIAGGGGADNLIPQLGRLALQGTGNALDLLNSAVVPATRDLLSTGGFDEARALASTMFNEDILPQILESGGQLGLRGGDSDLQAILAREGQRTSLQAASDAVNRKAGLLPFAAGLTEAVGTLPTSLAGNLFGFESQARAAERAATPGGQILDLLSVLGQIPTQGQSTSTSSGSSKSGTGGFNLI